MVSPTDGVFPSLLSCTKLGPGDTLYDIKFYPYATVGDEQIFAVTGGRDTFVCRIKSGAEIPYEYLRVFRDQDEDTSLNSLTWTQDPATQNPWLCVAGSHPRHIKILDIVSGDAVRTLTGHGREINDLATSPVSTDLVASCAQDSTIRLWSLSPERADQPCVAIFAGEGHRAPVLAICFHPNGKWLISGGIDTAVCLWAVPSLEQLGARKRNEPVVVYYPHFYTQELHPNYVDSFAFYNDLILSKSARLQITDSSQSPRNDVLLWQIEGFDADVPVPETPAIPRPGQQTRSSFDHKASRRGFSRILTFNIPNADRFYNRFGLFHVQDARPILCLGDQTSHYSFWDLQKLEEGMSPYESSLAGPKKKKKQGQQKKGLAALSGLRSGETSAAGSSKASTPTLRNTPDASTTTAAEGREFTLDDPFKPIEPHHKVTANTKLFTQRHFATRQIDWSPDGTWMVAVGDQGVMCMFGRDRSCL